MTAWRKFNRNLRNKTRRSRPIRILDVEYGTMKALKEGEQKQYYQSMVTGMIGSMEHVTFIIR